MAVSTELSADMIRVKSITDPQKSVLKKNFPTLLCLLLSNNAEITFLKQTKNKITQEIHETKYSRMNQVKFVENRL